MTVCIEIPTFGPKDYLVRHCYRLDSIPPLLQKLPQTLVIATAIAVCNNCYHHDSRKLTVLTQQKLTSLSFQLRRAGDTAE